MAGPAAGTADLKALLTAVSRVAVAVRAQSSTPCVAKQYLAAFGSSVGSGWRYVRSNPEAPASLQIDHEMNLWSGTSAPSAEAEVDQSATPTSALQEQPFQPIQEEIHLPEHGQSVSWPKAAEIDTIQQLHHSDPYNTASRTTDQQLGDSSKQRKVPVWRLSRLVQYGGLVAGIGMNVLSDRVKRSLGVETEDESGIMTKANVEKFVETMCRMRGAALKIGQIMSIQDNTLVPEELQQILERVRHSADFMPIWQMEKVMSHELGVDWRSKFREFDERPIAAASIGQVHRGVLHSGQEVAVKVQYPGIADSIDSDMGMLLTLLKMSRAFPDGLFLEQSVRSGRDELVLETDYVREAGNLERFRSYLHEVPFLHVPGVVHDISTARVLTTEMAYGVTLEKTVDLAQDVRNKIAYALMNLCMRELFQWQFMQTDPNWSNFMYDPVVDRLTLLDFGAAREYPKQFIDEYIRVIRAAAVGDRDSIIDASRKLGFLTGYESKVMLDAHVDAVTILGEPFGTDGPFDFAQQDVTARIHSLIPTMLRHRLTPPPQESYSLHRKLSGIFLLCAKLDAKIDCKSIFNPLYEQYSALPHGDR